MLKYGAIKTHVLSKSTGAKAAPLMIERQKEDSDMPDHKQRPAPGQQDCHDCPDGYKKAEVKLHGYVCIPEPCPPKMCTIIKHLPCNVEGEQIPGQLQNLLNQNPGYHIQQVLDHGHDGWSVILTGPC